MQYVTTHFEDGVYTITLNNPNSRNALCSEMFQALACAIHEIPEQTKSILLQGQGPVFCAGFDMNACKEDISILSTYIMQLSGIIRALRRLPVPVVAVAHGAAIAGGCAILTGCDFVVGEIHGKYGYPVHRIGVSPAVTLPTLQQKLHPGSARSLVMSGKIIQGNEAVHIGLLSHVEDTADGAHKKGVSIAQDLAQKPPIALQATKQWLNELDGSLEDALFDAPAIQSASSIGEETNTLLQTIWKKNDG